jgi:DNA processing protein
MDGLSSTEAWLRLNALELRPARARRLLEAFASDPSAMFSASEADWKAAAPWLSDKQTARLHTIQQRDFSKELATLEKIGARIITEQDPYYPAAIRPLPDAPPVLFVRGDLIPEDKFSIAIVGSRRASEYGLSLSNRFARELCSHGLAVVSGGARGVDTRAHRGALESGGRTIAFLGCGVDVNYPSDNRLLFQQIADQGGAVVSEYPLGTQPEPWRFPDRNRLISGISLGVLVIESPPDSGSLITARTAGEQGRDVFAIPGPIGDGRNSGCHKLIQDGAKLVECVDDILNELGVSGTHSASASPALSPPPPSHLPPEQRQVLEMLTLQPRHMDSLIAESGLTSPQVSGILTLLEMRGLARRVPGNAFVRVL